MKTTPADLLEQVVSGVESINQECNTDFNLSAVYYVPSEVRSPEIYHMLVRKLLRHYLEGKTFREIDNLQAEKFIKDNY